MAGEDQERLEDYLELEHYITELQAEHIAHPIRELTPPQASAYRMAALFHSASPEVGQPRPEFAAALQARLEQELQKLTKPEHLTFFSREVSSTPRKKRLHLSRRALLTGSAAAAASLVVGTELGVIVEHLTQPQTSGRLPQALGQRTTATQWPLPLVPDGGGSWIAVTKLTDLGDTAIRFATDTIVAYLIHSDGDNGEKPGVIAISAACTHMGCIVQWQSSDRKYHCPCHGGLFSEYGKPDKASPIKYLAALPRLETRITKQGTSEFIEVRVPANAVSKGGKASSPSDSV